MTNYKIIVQYKKKGKTFTRDLTFQANESGLTLHTMNNAAWSMVTSMKNEIVEREGDVEFLKERLEVKQ